MRSHYCIIDNLLKYLIIFSLNVKNMIYFKYNNIYGRRKKLLMIILLIGGVLFVNLLFIFCSFRLAKECDESRLEFKP